MAWYTEKTEWRTMATLGCTKAERLLDEYLKSLRNVNRASRDYLRAVQCGPQASIQLKGKLAQDMTDRMREAREAFQRHKSRHGCYLPEDSPDSPNSRKL